jgi:hypothetical protein
VKWDDAKANVSTYNSTRRYCFRKDGRAGDDTDTGIFSCGNGMGWVVCVVRDAATGWRVRADMDINVA